MASNIVFDGTKGISLPSFTTTEKNAIVSPSEGALIYDTTLNQTATYDGSSWNPNLNASSQTGLKNRIINGAMMIDQRNAGASVTNAAATPQYITDRFTVFGTSASKFSAQQNAGSVTPPSGFTNYLGVTSLAATTPATTDAYMISQYIEGFNIADLGWGTANATAITLSFWVRSSLTGTFGGALQNNAADRSYPFTYTISSSNTWEQKTITVAGDTTGTWLTNNSRGIALRFGLGIGSTVSGTAGSWAGANYYSATGATSVVGTNGATFYITGVQLEKGSTATSFDYRPYGTELALCQRYYETSYATGTAVGAITFDGAMFSGAPVTSLYTGRAYSVMKRAAPSVTVYNPFTGAANSSYGAIGSVSVSSVDIGVSAIRSFTSVNGAYANWHYAASSEL